MPTLLSQQGTQQRANTKETYDTNLADLKFAEDDAKQQYEFARGDVDEQYNSGVRDLSQRTQNTKMSILDQLRALESERAGGYVAANRSQFAGAQSAAQAALDQLLNYRAPEVAARDVQVRTPEMREYGVDQAELEAANPEMDGSVLDYLPQLLRRQREQAGYL